MIAPAGSDIGAERQPTAAPWDGSRRLWSLWEMFEINASAFHSVSGALGRLRGALDANKEKHGAEIDAELLDMMRLMIEGDVISHFYTLRTRISIMAATELLEKINAPPVTRKDFSRLLEDVSKTFGRELRATKCLVIEAERQRYYLPDAPLFGPEFAEKFISAAFKLDEAAKCLVLSRPTAATFHLMRIMEIGIKSVTRCLGIPDPIKPSDRNWGKFLDRIKSSIYPKDSRQRTFSAGDKEFFESAYASLDAVKVAWRNPTMHVENKYTDDEAEHIFLVVKGFAMKLASRCDENGDPKA